MKMPRRRSTGIDLALNGPGVVHRPGRKKELAYFGYLHGTSS
jgi:hypothetical protein